MARTHGRAPRGERLRAPIPHGHRKTTTFVAALRNTGLIAPMALDGPINGGAFQAYVDQVLVPNKLKAMLRKAAARNVETLWDTIGGLTEAFTPTECAHYFAAAGYDAE